MTFNAPDSLSTLHFPVLYTGSMTPTDSVGTVPCALTSGWMSMGAPRELEIGRKFLWVPGNEPGLSLR